MQTQREKSALRVYLALIGRYGEDVVFTPVTEDPRAGLSQDQTRSKLTIKCLVQRGDTEESALSFGKRNDLMNVAVGEIALKCHDAEFGETRCKKGDFVELQSHPPEQFLKVDRVDARHPPFLFLYLMNVGNSQ